MAVGDIGRFDTRHCRAFDHVGGVGLRAADHGFLHAIGRKDGPFFDIDRLRREGGFKLAYVISNWSSVLSMRERVPRMVTQYSAFCSHHQILCGLAMIRIPL